jgi:uncharacterized sulfatase
MQAHAEDRPNILWITCEDMSPSLGCFGDSFAKSPVLDRFAERSVRYTNTYATAPVCAVARSSIITGVWSTTLGSNHMRCTTRLPDNVKCFSEYLRNSGYYCTNNVKTDYNFAVPKNAWDESSNQAHWRKRPQGKPFFSVFNFTGTHESQCRTKPKSPERFPPSRTAIPPFHPDRPEVRDNWAKYYENISEMDTWAGDLLAQLSEDGLAENTIVFFYSDHGAGMPGIKKQCWGPGLHVPLIIHVPEKYARWAPGDPGTSTDRLVSFIDFAPTVLSLVGLDIPAHMAGSAFLGAQAASPRTCIHALRDRMGERYDMVRVVRTKQLQYNLNFKPWYPWSAFMSYTEDMPTMQVWRQDFEQGKLNAVQARYFAAPKPLEELYDVENDPWQINNLAEDPLYAAELPALRAELRRWMEETHDLGLLPEHEVNVRAKNRTPYEVAHDPSTHPFARLWDAAETARALAPARIPELVALLDDPDSALRWWGATGLHALGTAAAPARDALAAALEDPAPLVRVAAAEGMAKLGEDAAALDVLTASLDGPEFVQLSALIVLDSMGERARPALDAIRACKASEYGARMVEYIPARNFGLAPKG